MALAGYRAEATFTPQQALLAGMDDTISRQITLAVGQNLKRGSLLGRVTATGRYVLSLAAAADGSQNPAAILAEDSDASAAEKVTVAYFAGTFDENVVIYGTGQTAANTREALRSININLQSSITA